MPRIIRITIIGLMSWPLIRPSNWSGRPARLMKLEKISAPITTANREEVVIAVSDSTSQVLRQLRLRRASAMMKAPAAPMPAASVGVNTPP